MTIRRSVLPLVVWTAVSATACHRRAPENTNPPPSASSARVAPPTGGAAPMAQPPAAAAPATPGATPGAAPQVPAGVPVPAAQIAPQTQNGGSLAITSSNPVLFRWQDGDWVVRITYSIRNNGTAPADFDRVSLRLADWTPWGTASTLPEHATVNPGLTVSGDAAWYFGGSNPQPTSVTVNYAPGDSDDAPVLATRTFQPVFSPAPPAAGAVPTSLVYTLPIVVTAPGLTFVHTDGDRTVRFSVAVTNTTGAPLRIPIDYFHGKIDDQDGTRWSAVTTLPETLEIAPGATASGTIGWYWSGDHGVPATVNVSFGPSNSPQFNSAVAVAVGPSPVQ